MSPVYSDVPVTNCLGCFVCFYASLHPVGPEALCFLIVCLSVRVFEPRHSGLACRQLLDWYNQTRLSGKQWDLIMSTGVHLGGVSTYPRFILYILTK